MALTDTQIRKVKTREKPFKLTDEKGLFLLVNPNGSKLWRFKYRFAEKEKSLSIGMYPDVTLADARSKRDEARQLLVDNVDPGMAKQLKKRAKKLGPENCFEAIAREWHIKFCSKWTDDHNARILHRLEKDIFSWLGNHPINEITAPELLIVLRRVENRGAIETAHRIGQSCGQIFRYAIATGQGRSGCYGRLARCDTTSQKTSSCFHYRPPSH